MDLPMSLDLIIIAIVLAAASGMPGLCFKRSSVWGQRIAVVILGIGSTVGLAGIVLGFPFDQNQVSLFPWPAAGNSLIGADALSAFFLVPIFLMGTLGAVYGLGYWPQQQHPRNGRKLRLFWGLLVAGMSLLVISRHAMAFLLGWEVMALSAFFLIDTEDFRNECRQASYLYILCTHLGTLSLFALFALWRWATGSYVLQPVAVHAISLGTMNALFLLALIGFGVKAGMMPLHFWLPTAHANAPSHVSAIMSGVVIKMGIYGLLRFLSLLPEPPAIWGGTILTLGGISGLLGVLFAIGQHDLKRLLAYHSVENIGIILMGLGLAMLGRSTGRPEWIVLGLAGCLLHVWNHSLFKSLLFLCAGSVVHATHTREIDHLGGLAKKMPWTAAMFLVGAVAICGLPPLNGFVSELFVYLGLFQSLGIDGKNGSAAMIAVPVLATIGALAVACFVKVYGVVFLGNSRTLRSEHAQESPLSMRGPMVVLAVCCALIGLAPVLVSPILDAVIRTWMPELHQDRLGVATLVPLGSIGAMSILLVVLIAGFAKLFLRYARVTNDVNTWDCGYARPTHRMQYTASSFAQMIVSLFRWVLHPRIHSPSVQGLFPQPTKFHTEVDDVVLDRLLVPASRIVERCVGWIRTLQHGLTQHYVLYILITVILMLSLLIPFDEFLARLFAR
jgi:hydrogenase-4 component B